MIYFRHEGDKLDNGINFYPLSSMSSIGLRLKWNKKIYLVRYSKFAKKWFIGRLGI
jgi:hypothetical protein